MFTVIFDTDTDGAKLVVRTLRQRTTPQGLRHFLRNTVEPFLVRRIENRFRREGDDVTGRWHPLSVATEAFRRRAGFPAAHPINVRTTQMRDYLENSSATINPVGGDMSLVYPGQSPNALTEKKIRVAQRGQRRRPVTPPRPVLGMNRNDLQYITSELTEYLVRGFI